MHYAFGESIWTFQRGVQEINVALRLNCTQLITIILVRNYNPFRGKKQNSPVGEHRTDQTLTAVEWESLEKSPKNADER